MKTKAQNISIINISAIQNKNGHIQVVGLGDDSNVYCWNSIRQEWYLFS